MDVPHRIEVVRHRRHPALRGLVAGVIGMSESAPGAVWRRQPAGSLVPLVLSFGEHLHVESLSDGVGAGRAYGSFIAGLSTGFASTRFEGGQACVQVYLTPVGVRRLVDVPGVEVARRVIALDDVLPAWGASFSDQLASAATWRDRLSIVEMSLMQRLGRASGPPDWVTLMCNQITASGGRARVGDLVARSGWSHRHVAQTFAKHVGLTPKQLSGVVRFERAAAELGRHSVAEVAARHGYADQSHLHRDALRYAGETPAQHGAARRPTARTALGI